MRVIVTSKNPVKLEATKQAFKQVFSDKEIDFEVVTVPSGVSDQPMSEAETMKGAKSRAKNAKEQLPDADYWVGIEGGVQIVGGEMLTYAWIYVLGKGLEGKARSASFYLPEKIKVLVESGKELGDADDIVFGKSNSKQQNGAVGILTHDIITRTALYIPAIVLALIPFKNTKLYKE